MAEKIQKRLLTIKEASEYLGIQVKTLYKWVYEKKIPYVKFSHKSLKFDKIKLDEWIDRQTIHPVNIEEKVDKILSLVYNKKQKNESI